MNKRYISFLIWSNLYFSEFCCGLYVLAYLAHRCVYNWYIYNIDKELNKSSKWPVDENMLNYVDVKVRNLLEAYMIYENRRLAIQLKNVTQLHVIWCAGFIM